MIRIHFNPEELTGDQKVWWDDWYKTAAEFTNEAIELWEKGEKIKFHDGHWGKLKDWLLKEIFNDKCAYCETIMDRATYHAEHYRPKGEVSVKDFEKNKAAKVKIENPLGELVEHPGYFWLAYNWKNLLPSCQNCNTYGGKGIQFPALKGHLFLKKMDGQDINKIRTPYYESKKYPGYYYLDPEDLNEIEAPLLLHPYFDSPNDYLVFGVRGIVTARDSCPKGVNSINVYNLKDEKIRQARQAEQENASRLVSSFFNVFLNSSQTQDSFEKDIISQIKLYTTGKAKYSAAAKWLIDNKIHFLSDIIEEDH